MHRVLTIAAFALLGFAAAVDAANAGAVWRAVEVKGDARAGSRFISSGAELDGDVIIQTGADAAVTLVCEGTRLVIGANARVHLPTAGGEAEVLQGSAAVQRAGASRVETVHAGSSTQIAAATTSSYQATTYASAAQSTAMRPAEHAPAAPVAADPQITTRRQGTGAAPPPSHVVMTSSAATSSSLPATGAATSNHAMAAGLGNTGGGSMRVDAPRPGNVSAPALRTSSASDVDLTSAPGHGGGLQLDGDASNGGGPHRTLDQQVGSASAAFSEASHQPIVPVDKQAAVQLLDRVKPDFERSHEDDGAQSVMNKAGGVMAAIILLQLVSMGLLALWRYTKQPKAEQAQPRWRSL